MGEIRAGRVYWRYPRLLALIIGMSLVSCSGNGPSDAASGVLIVAEPLDGDVVGSSSVQVRGTAPAGAEIVQDISFSPDKRTSADAAGNWVLTVDLEEGPNDISIRIGSDASTTKTIRVTYEPGSANGEPSPTTSAVPTKKPNPTSSPKPTPTPRPTPKPTPKPASFGEGDLIVGADVRPGTYRTRQPAFLCYWERLSGFSGGLNDIIANGSGSGYSVVTIGKSDKGFSSSGCGTWTADLSQVKRPGAPIAEDGTYIVGTDVTPGTWRSRGGGSFACYAARLSGFGGTLNDIISNEIGTNGGLIVTIARSDAGFETSGCGKWERIN
jgi:hypothetical protein